MAESGDRSGGSRGAERRARLAAQRAAEARRRKRVRLLARSGIAVAALAVVGGFVALFVSTSGGPGGAKDAVASVPAQPRTTSEGRTASPPWPVPVDPQAAVQAAGLPMLSAEGTVEHIHAHLDVFANGGKVTVPADIGIVRRRSR